MVDRIAVDVLETVRDKYGIKIKFIKGVNWESNGNGQWGAYKGALIHHTATPTGDAPRVLWEGRSDLAGPLCNFAGNGDGSLSPIASHPANHAGASGGRSMGPLPISNTFNKQVLGLEIVYPGVTPMNVGQYHAAVAFGAAVSDVLGRPSAEWIRGHGETSITGKWDPGRAPNTMIDMVQYRRDVQLMRTGNRTGDAELNAEEREILNRIDATLRFGKANERLPGEIAASIAAIAEKVDNSFNPETFAELAVLHMSTLIKQAVKEALGQDDGQAQKIIDALAERLAPRK